MELAGLARMYPGRVSATLGLGNNHWLDQLGLGTDRPRSTLLATLIISATCSAAPATCAGPSIRSECDGSGLSDRRPARFPHTRRNACDSPCHRPTRPLPAPATAAAVASAYNSRATIHPKPRTSRRSDHRSRPQSALATVAAVASADGGRVESAGLAGLGEHRGQLVDGAGDLVGGDHQRRGEPDGRAVGVLDQDARAPSGRRLTSRPVPSAGSMSTPAHSPTPRTAVTPCADQAARARSCSTGAELGRRALALARRPASGPRRCRRPPPAGCRRRSSRAGPGRSTPSTSRVADHGRHRHHAAAEGLAQQVQVGHHADVVDGEGRRRCGRARTGSRRRSAAPAARSHSSRRPGR